MFRLPLTLALLGLTTAAVAQPPAANAGTGSGISADAWTARARTRLMALDTNHDGKLSKDEFAARGAMMGGHHGGHWGGPPPGANGTPPPADRSDMAPPPLPPGGPDGQPQRPHDGARMFARLDANGDGVLDTGEINALLARRFARLDANHDGMLTQDERHAMRGHDPAEQ